MKSMRNLLGLAVAVFATATIAPAHAASVAAGGWHALALDASGAVRSWGRDTYGQLGLGRLGGSALPVRVAGISNIKAADTGGLHIVALASDGSVWAWGKNSDGQLGDGTSAIRTRPVQVAGLAAVIAVSAGAEHSLALKADGSVWAWGANRLGQLGIGYGPSQPAPVRVQGLDRIVAISAGERFNLALRDDGSVWSWGDGSQYQLGDGSSLGRAHAAQVTGLPPALGIDASSYRAVAAASDGTVWTWGQSLDRARPSQVQGYSGIAAVAAGREHVLAIDAGAAVWASGSNTWGQLGRGTVSDVLFNAPAAVAGVTGAVAVAGGSDSSFALRADGVMLAWGHNLFGQLGDGTNANRGNAVVVPGLPPIAAISAATYSTVAVARDGSVWVWGLNYSGVFGDGVAVDRSSPARLTALPKATGLSSAGFHAAAVTESGEVWSWGNNNTGQLGDGTASTSPRGQPMPVAGASDVVAVAAGGETPFGGHTVAIKRDRTLLAWGSNFSGQLGSGTTSPGPVTSPIAVAGIADVGAVAAGDGYTLALKTDGTVWIWGGVAPYNASGPSPQNPYLPSRVAGLDRIVAVAAARSNALALRDDGTVWSWGAYEGTPASGPSLNRIEELGDIVAIATGGGHSLAVQRDGTVWAWGVNFAGQLGDGTRTNRAVPARVAGLSGVVEVSAASGLSLARKADGSLWAWGANTYGQLGDGTFVDRTRPVVVRAEGGSGKLDTGNWYLDLTPADGAAIPAEASPKLLVQSELARAESVIELRSAIRYQGADAGTAVHNYVLAVVPAAFFDLVKRAPHAPGAAELQAKAGTQPVLAQLTPDGWSAVQGAFVPYSSGTAAESAEADILDAIDGSRIAGAKFCVGYGASADAMIATGTLREVLAVPGGADSATCLDTLNAIVDSDGDGMTNAIEIAFGRDPLVKDNDIFADPGLFVMQQYRDFLAREGDTAGIAHWTSLLAAGTQDRVAMVRTFFSSAEFEGVVAPVARLYFAYFLRVPDYGGLRFWIAQHAAGNPLATISERFAQSPEFIARYGALGNAQFVTLVYRNVLGRDPDAEGLAHWQGRLDRGELTRGQAMLAFSESEEYRGLSAGEVRVTMTYAGMLRRAPDAAGFSFWVDYVDRGNTLEALIAGFLASAEYRSRFLP